MAIHPSQITTLLEELADWFALENVEPIELLVCGGAAMGLQHLHHRVTADVDVLGRWNAELAEVACIEDFSPEMKRCIERVAGNHPELQGFKNNWVNLGPQNITRQGLP
jgi:hypothetical protein